MTRKAITLADLRVTDHAITRYRERVARLPAEQVRAILTSEIVLQAITFGARYIRLGTGQRIVLDGDTVVTVLPCGSKGQRLRDDPHGNDRNSRSRPRKPRRLES